MIYSNSRVHGNRMLYVEARLYYYKLTIKMLVPGFLPRGDVEEGISEAWLIYTTYYYAMMQQLLLHCYLFHALYELLAVSILMLQDSSEDASLR